MGHTLYMFLHYSHLSWFSQKCIDYKMNRKHGSMTISITLWIENTDVHNNWRFSVCIWQRLLYLCHLLLNRTSARLHRRFDKRKAHQRHGPRQSDTSNVLQLQRCFPNNDSNSEVHQRRQGTILIHPDQRIDAQGNTDIVRSESICSHWYVVWPHDVSRWWIRSFYGFVSEEWT